MGWRARIRILASAALVASACSSASSTPEPSPAAASARDEAARGEGDSVEPASLDEIAFPDYPPSAADGVEACARDYRAIAGTPFPDREEGQSFDAWYAGPFQRWVDHYNAVRARCDEVFAALDETGADAQVILATQAYMHQRLGQEAVPYEPQPQMFVMSRYWTLGASCTYDHCARGPLEAWSALCRAQGRMLPDCPPVEPREPAAAEAP